MVSSILCLNNLAKTEFKKEIPNKKHFLRSDMHSFQNVLSVSLYFTNFMHLSFIAKVVGVSDGSLGSSICSAVQEAFLDGPLRGGLTSLDEDTRSLYLALTAKIVISVSSPMLVNGGSGCVFFIDILLIYFTTCWRLIDCKLWQVVQLSKSMVVLWDVWKSFQ